MAAYIAALLIVAAAALFVAAPLTEGFLRRKRSVNLEMARHEHQCELALQGLRELEFDHEMGKLDESDYRNLKASLENRALAAMRVLEQLAQEHRIAVVRLAPPRSPSAASTAAGTVRSINFCPQCGMRAEVNYRFCAGCGVSLEASPRGRVQAQ
jgi:cytochrome c-type biogenesis protein CcmI